MILLPTYTFIPNPKNIISVEFMYFNIVYVMKWNRLIPWCTEVYSNFLENSAMYERRNK